MSFSPVPPPVNGPVGPLERGLAVLRELTRLAAQEGRATVRPGDLVRGTGLARSVVDRVVATLEQLGYVTLDGRDIGLAVRLMELGNAYLAASGLPAALGPFAERLADGLDESVSVAVPDGGGVRFVVQVTRRRTMSLAFRIGDLLPAERCSPGPLFAAEWSGADWAAWRARRAGDPLDTAFPAVPPRHRPDSGADFEARVKEAAHDGWATDDQLIEPGLVAVSVPVRDASGRIACAVNVVSHTSRHDVDSLRAAVLGPLGAEVPAMEAALAAPRRRPAVLAASTASAAPAASAASVAPVAPVPWGVGAFGPAGSAPGAPSGGDDAGGGAGAVGTTPLGPAAGGGLPAADETRAESALGAPSSGPSAQPAGSGRTRSAAGAASAAVGGTSAVGEDPARMAKRELGAGFLQSLARGLAVLRALGGVEATGWGETRAVGGAGQGEASAVEGVGRSEARSVEGVGRSVGRAVDGEARAVGDAARGASGAAGGIGGAGGMAHGLVGAGQGGGLGGGMTLTAVAEATGLARATARRSLLTLVELGYAEADGRTFRPLPRVLELGYAPLAELGFTDIAQPHMRELVRTVHESASLAVLDGGDIRYIARVPTVRIMSVNITIGTRFPAYATSMGRVLLAGLDADARAAHLADVRPRPLTRHTVTSVPELARVVERAAAEGHALVDQELEEGLRSLAVPVRDARGRVVAALNVATHAGRGTAESVRGELLPALRATAARIEADLATASAHHALGAGERVGA
ncbi:IclR family transcriptional regulator C-terminal domain-containing protein [Streptomyces malaysiensis subsp. malaysiensis]|uniref:IclR family transcriptional regulator domain-containing protein n=1 Tax=Streptomyces malaysiensis TaxID=92644 RepID=UPI0024C0968F|nr:IclR family transcriptional regulator C-terminal domain-containing protein [Streptomyces sp. NA07423]WHX24104.1 IclR family transcriptional regulator C-terminal domain-containing protein [Streptomyces sp. NA07423]